MQSFICHVLDPFEVQRLICIDGQHLGLRMVAVIRNREVVTNQGFLHITLAPPIEK